MLGVLLLLVYIILGICLAHILFTGKNAITKIWLGAVFGIVGLMWSHVPFSFMMGFTKGSHILGLLLFCCLIFVAGTLRQKKTGVFPNPFKNFKKTWHIDVTKSVSWMMVVFVIFMLIATILLFTHTLSPSGDGGYTTGQATYGDMNFHLNIITSVSKQETFPPDYSIFPGEKLDYYFFCDSVSSSLLTFGTGLRLAYLLPMLVGFSAVFMGFWILADTILKDRKKTLLAFIFLFLNGGLGTVYFLNKEKFNDIFFGYYCTPTNYRFKGDGEPTLIWVNSIADMLLPQRATLFGWMVIIAIFWLLYNAVFERDRDAFLPAGVLAGLAPMIQTYAYFATGLVALCWLIYSFVQIREIKGKKVSQLKAVALKERIIDWLKFGIPAVVFAVPQFFIWIFKAVEGESFLNIQFNAFNESGDFWPWFWIKNVGLVAILLIPAFIMASRKMKAVYSGALLIFTVTEIVVFQTFTYDNNKLYFMWYLFSCILVAGWIVDMLGKIKTKSIKPIIVALVVFIATNAGILSLSREIISGFPIEDQFYCNIGIYSADQVKACEFIDENLEKDATFLSAYNHTNAIAALTGRNIYCGSGTFLNSHGVDYAGRQQLIELMFRSGEDFERNKAKCGIDYVYISGSERGSIRDLNEQYFADNYPCIYDVDGVRIFDVR